MLGRALLCPSVSNVNLLRYRKSIVDLYAKISDGALNSGVAKQELHRAEIAGALVDQGGLGPPKRVSSEEVRVEASALAIHSETSRACCLVVIGR
jgi:hypothetical protein